MRAMTFALLVLAVTSAFAQDTGTRLVEGTVYSYMKDGVRHYSARLPEGVEYRTIKYSFLEATRPDPGWVPVGQGEGMSLFYLATNMTRSGRSASVWVMNNYAASQTAPSMGSFRSTVERWTVDCPDKSMGTQQATYYAGAFGKNQVVGTWRPLGGPSMQFAVPGSMGEAIVETACKPAKKPAKKPAR